MRPTDSFAASEGSPRSLVARNTRSIGKTGLAAAVLLAGLAACGGDPSSSSDSAAPATSQRSVYDGSFPAQNAPLPGRYFVASADPRATEAGLAILARGGSAADAAVAVEAMLTLVEPQSSGFGGGGFMLYFDQETGQLHAYDGRETAPASARPDMFLTANGERMPGRQAVVGGLSVGVPGVVAMLGLAHDAHGKLPWSALFDDAIEKSENGFIVSPRLSRVIGAFPRLSEIPASRAYFFDETGAPRAPGTLLRNPDYADVLRAVAANGPAAMYDGPIAQAIVDAVNNAPFNPTTMTLDDIRAYEPKERQPVCLDYRKYTVCAMSPPTSGGPAVLQILGILENFDMGALEPWGADALHLYLEATKLAYADRNRYVGDPDFVDVPVEGMLNKEYLATRAALIDPGRAQRPAAGDPTAFMPSRDARLDYADDASLELPSTTHFSIVDADGDVVSMTATIESGFGSHLMALGMPLNNQLTDFSFVPEQDGRPVANAVAPGKRPRSSTAPTIVFDENGQFYAAIGSPGGSRIIGYVAKTLLGVLDWELSMQEAVDLGNVVAPYVTAELEEGYFSEDIVADLRSRGHEVRLRRVGSGLYGVRVVNGAFDAGVDGRRDGAAGEGALED